MVNGATSKLGVTTTTTARGSVVAPLPRTANNSVSTLTWKKGAILSKGPFGCVYLGFDKNLGRLVAAKEMQFQQTDHAVRQRIESMVKEIELLRRLDHKNVVQFFSSERVGATRLIMFMEYVAGGSLSGLIRQFGKLQIPVARSFTQQIVVGVAYLHRNGVVHSDIQCDNILVNVEGVLKLSDFGSATLNAVSSMQTGPAEYMPPEVIRGEPVTWHADIWCIGCAVVEMVTGKPPFSSLGNKYKIMRFVAGDEDIDKILEIQVLPQLLKDFVLECLERDATKRASAQTLLQHPFLQDDDREDRPEEAPTTNTESAESESTHDMISVTSSDLNRVYTPSSERPVSPTASLASSQLPTFLEEHLVKSAKEMEELASQRATTAGDADRTPVESDGSGGLNPLAKPPPPPQRLAWQQPPQKSVSFDLNVGGVAAPEGSSVEVPIEDAGSQPTRQPKGKQNTTQLWRVLVPISVVVVGIIVVVLLIILT